MLYRKFHETVLNHFGFRNYVQPNPHNGPSNIQQNFNQTFTQNNQPPLPPSNIMAQTHSVIPRRERSLSNESRKREKSVERVPNMMKREVNNSRANLDANNTSNMSNKPKPSQNPSIVTIPTQQSRNTVPSSMGMERPPHINSQQQFAQQQASYNPQQQVNVSNTSSNFLSQGNSNSNASSRAIQQSDPFSSYASSLVNNRNQAQTQQSYVFTSQ